MSLDFFRVERGLQIDDLVTYLQGSGVPGLSADTDSAERGSVYTNVADGSLWTKISVGTGTVAWQKMASEQYVNNAVGATVSWREPVVALDNIATVVPTGTATQPVIIDGVSVTNGQRVLFAAVVGGDGKNVYVYDQATGVFVEDTNAETAGDAVYVQGGTSAGKTFVFNGTAWVQSDQASLDELGFLRAFVGKSAAGAEMPLYTSNNYVGNNTSLESAIGELDRVVGPNVNLGNFVSPANKVQENIQALDTQLGANVVAGNHITPANSTNANIAALDTQIGAELLVGNFIAAGDALSTAITKLDNEFGPNVSTGNFVTSSNKVNANLQALDTAIGAPVTDSGVILSTNSANQNIQAIADELAETTQQATSSNVTSVVTVDSVTADGAKWLVRCELASDPTRVYSTEIFALSNGAAVDFTRYGTLRIGTAIPGLSVTADFSGGAIRLRVASTGAVNVQARRVGTLV